MKRVVFILLAVMCASTIFGQTEKQKVVVWVDGKNIDINTVLADQLVSVITSGGKYIAIERSADFLRAVRNEMEYMRSGNVADDEIARLGRQFGANLVCASKVSQIANTNYVSARIIDIETTQVIATANIHDDFKTIEAIVNVCEELASQLLGIRSKAEIVKQEQEATKSKLEQDIDRGYTIVGNTLYVQTLNAAGSVDYKRACDICSKSRIGRFSDWRLPTLEEAKRMQATISMFRSFGYHTNDNNSRIWTSTLEEKGNLKYFPKYATFDFARNFSSSLSSPASTSVRCVRGR